MLTTSVYNIKLSGTPKIGETLSGKRKSEASDTETDSEELAITRIEPKFTPVYNIPFSPYVDTAKG